MYRARYINDFIHLHQVMDLGRRPASPGAGGTVSGITTMDEDEDNVVSVCSKEGQEDNREQEQGGGSDTPALFVTGMPRDVWANPSLGALAALIDEADEEQQQGAVCMINGTCC